MADLPEHTLPDDEKAQSRRIRPWLFAVVALALVGGGIFWSNYRGGAAPPADRTQPAAELAGQQQGQTAQQLATLQQTLKDLQTAQQRLQEELAAVQGRTAEIDDLKRQVLAGQDERKSLSDQLGALSARVDSLVAPSAEASIPPATAAKKKRGAR